jgi:hypothetical protein
MEWVDDGSTGRVRDMTKFDPGFWDQSRFDGYGRAPIPDRRDEELDRYVEGLRAGGPVVVGQALGQVSDAGRRVLRAYGERAASRAVRSKSVDSLILALVAVVVGGLDQNALEALMPVSLIEDAGLRVGADPGVYFGKAADIVGHPGSVNLMVWLARNPEDRTPEAMGFVASEDLTGFRYKWAY